MDIKDLKDALDATTSELKTAVATQSDEIKKYGETQASTAALIAKADERFNDITADIEAKSKRMDEMEARFNRAKEQGQEQSKSLGGRFVESEVYKNYVAGGGRGDSAGFEAKDITGASASAGGLIPEFRVPTIFANPDRPMFVRELVNNSTCSGDSVTIMRENVFTNNAGPQYDGNGNPVNQLVDKNKSDITYASSSVPVRTMAHHIIASRQILSDAPRLRSMIDQRLPYGLNLNMDSQLLYGDGLTENFTGLFTDAGVNDVGEIATGTSEAELPLAMIKKIRNAVTTCQMSEFYNVNGLLLNPQDWETIETATGTDNKFIWVTVGSGAEARLWRVPVVVSNAVTQGDFLMGDWSMGATLYQREGITVRASESHANLFTQNGVAILGEERAAFAVELPKAFTKGSFVVAGA